MYVEFYNFENDTYYYLCGSTDNLKAVAWYPDIRDELYLSVDNTVGELKKRIIPVVEQLVNETSYALELNFFQCPEQPVKSLTSPLGVVVMKWRVSEPTYINGIKQPIRLTLLN